VIFLWVGEKEVGLLGGKLAVEEVETLKGVGVELITTAFFSVI
jgi:hypothetical protein